MGSVFRFSRELEKVVGLHVEHEYPQARSLPPVAIRYENEMISVYVVDTVVIYE